MGKGSDCRWSLAEAVEMTTGFNGGEGKSERKEGERVRRLLGGDEREERKRLRWKRQIWTAVRKKMEGIFALSTGKDEQQSGETSKKLEEAYNVDTNGALQDRNTEELEEKVGRFLEEAQRFRRASIKATPTIAESRKRQQCEIKKFQEAWNRDSEMVCHKIEMQRKLEQMKSWRLGGGTRLQTSKHLSNYNKENKNSSLKLLESMRIPSINEMNMKLPYPKDKHDRL
ncbi:hypothetical protein HAX54_030393 [Datura stramonium]|uniref:Uncharacterized protein n=1 Tax=Datura stramonium TaxID=4076 RepID=A0ABS8V8W9_DATST|nr:hypothetical protein [Datura stramonium]